MWMGPYRAVLFDMDGVVIDTRQSVTDFWTAFAGEQGVTLTAEDFDRHIFGVSVAHTLEVLFPKIHVSQYDALLKRTLDYETQLRYSEIAGAVTLLRTLKKADIPTALVTSGRPWKVAEVIRQLALEAHFEVVITAGDIESGKPDPACYLTAAHRVGVAATECVVFEDAVSGVQAALAAGTFCVGVQTGRMADLLVAEEVSHIIPDFAGVKLDHSTAETLLLHVNKDLALPLVRGKRAVTPSPAGGG